jgi:hypothetical protein
VVIQDEIDGEKVRLQRSIMPPRTFASAPRVGFW